jgi:hypothetical protein
MADRRAKQQAFEERQRQKNNVVLTEDRELKVFTASISYKDLPEGIEHTFDLSEVSVDIKLPLSQSALDPELQQAIMSKSKFKKLLSGYLGKIEENDWHTILITCAHGMHRSVAMAESIKAKYPQCECIHLMLS